MNLSDILQLLILVSAVVAIIVTGLLVWKTKAADVWRSVAEAREQRLDEAIEEIASLKSEVNSLKEQVKYLERKHDGQLLSEFQKMEARAQTRHEAEIALLAQLVKLMKESSK